MGCLSFITLSIFIFSYCFSYRLHRISAFGLVYSFGYHARNNFSMAKGLCCTICFENETKRKI